MNVNLAAVRRNIAEWQALTLTQKKSRAKGGGGMAKLSDMTTDELEAALACAIDKAENLPKSEESRRIYWQVHARTIQERIDDLGAMRRESLGCTQSR